MLNVLRFATREHGVGAAEMLAPLGLDLATLSATDAVVSAQDMGALLMRVQALTGEPFLDVRLGLQAQLPLFGYLGFALMTADTVGQALRLAVDFTPAQTDAVQPSLTVAGDQAAVTVGVSPQFGSAQAAVATMLLVGLSEGVTAWIGHRTEAATGSGIAPARRIELTRPAPEGWPPAFLPPHLACVFDAPENRLCIAAALLQAPVAAADPVARELALTQCRDMLEQRPSQDDLVVRARAVLSARPADDRSPDALARAGRVDAGPAATPEGGRPELPVAAR